MLFHNLSKTVSLQQIVNATAAGTTDVTSSAIDTQGYSGVLIVVSLGTLTSTTVPSVKAQQSSDDGSTDDYSDLAGSKVAGDDTMGNKLLVLDIHKPQKRYLKAIIGRATANTAVNAAWAVLYNPDLVPPTQVSVGASKVLNSPAEGTA